MVSITTKKCISHYLFTEYPDGLEVSSLENENIPEYQEKMNGVRVFYCRFNVTRLTGSRCLNEINNLVNAISSKLSRNNELNQARRQVCNICSKSIRTQITSVPLGVQHTRVCRPDCYRVGSVLSKCDGLCRLQN